MARRVYMSSDRGLLIGKPGIDAAGAADNQLLFNSNAYSYNGLFRTGIIVPGAFGESSAPSQYGQGTVYRRVATVGHGRGFSAPPRLLFGCRDPQTGGYVQSYYTNDYTLGQGTAAVGNGCVIVVRGYTDTSNSYFIVSATVYPQGTQYDFRSLYISYALFLGGV